MAVEKNLIQIQSELQSPAITDETLVKYANGSSASVPSFLALMEMSRRKQLEEGSKAYDTSNQKTIKDQLANALTAPNQMKGALTGAPANQVNPTAAPTGIAMGAAPANQVNPTQAPPQPQPANIGTVGAAEGGLMSLPVNHFNSSSYAGGGIVAFAEGGLNSEEKQLSSFPQERRLSPQSLDEASIMAALAPAAQPVESAPRGRGASGFQSVLDSLPKVQANTMPAPQELTREQLYENIKENQRLAGVSQDPYAEVNKRQAAIEARQKAGYEQQGLDRLLTQLNAFAKADPARGTGYAGAVSSDASMALEQQQNALREKQEQAQLDYAKNIAKEEDARRRGDATGIQAALEAQKKDKLEFAKLGQEDQKLESYRMNTAANVYQTDEYAKARRDAAAQAAANKPDPDDVLYNRIMAKAETDFTIKMLTKKQELLDIGSDEYNAIENEKYRLLSTYFAKRPDLMPKKPEASVSSKPPETPGWWSRNAPAILGGSPTVSFDKLPK
jgi:hypothetical protein